VRSESYQQRSRPFEYSTFFVIGGRPRPCFWAFLRRTDSFCATEQSSLVSSLYSTLTAILRGFAVWMVATRMLDHFEERVTSEGWRSILKEKSTMLKTELSRKTYRLFLAAVALASIAMFVEACNTSQPPNQQVKDSQITTEVKGKLATNVRASSLANIEVNTTNGVVTLAGQVENPDVKRSAGEVAATVPGVARVNNNLQVAPASAAASP
jgi:BON domain